MKGIRWTEDERDLVKENLVEILKEHHGITKSHAFRLAQEILDPGRQRDVISIIATPSHKPIWAAALRELKLSDTSSKPQKKEDSPTEPEKVFVPVPTPLDIKQIPDNVLLAEAIVRILDRLTLPQAQTAPVTTANKAMTASSPLPFVFGTKEVQPNYVPRVGVVGLLRDQFNHLKGRVNQKKVELIWVDKDKRYDFPPSLEYVLVQRHTSHEHYNHAKAEFGNDRVFFVDGGITQCAEKINTVFPGSLN